MPRKLTDDQYIVQILQLSNANMFDFHQILPFLSAMLLFSPKNAKRKSPASSEDDAEPIEAEVVEGEIPSGAATDEQKITVIQQQINVIQNGEKNFNLTNNGTMNFNF